MLNRIKRFTINTIGDKNINKIQYALSYKYKNDLIDYKDTKKIIYFLVPQHGNMGDQAIAYATRKFLNENLKEYMVLEFERDEVYKYGKAIKNILNKDDLIVLHGGGNMGNLYLREEEPRRFIINKFRKNKILSMTQTITFTNNEEGNQQKEKTAKIYNSNKNLTLLARENKSYDTMRDLFKNNKVIKVPDIVFYLEDLFEHTSEREYIMTCLRKDKECYFGEKKVEFLKKIKEIHNIVESDTAIKKVVTEDIREEELFKMWNNFRKSKVVITDRLHGMVFATITKTPCIVLRSLDHKVIETYKWVKGLNYIRFVEDINIEEINKLIDELSCLTELDRSNFKEVYFKSLKDKLEVM